MYELYIEDSDGVFRLADLGNTVPAMNYQTNDMGELEYRNNNYSMTIKLPITDNNVRIFEFSNNPDTASYFSYTNHNCRLYCDGITLAGPGAFLVLNTISDFYFECQIKSGIKSFVDTLKELPMSSIDLGSVTYGAQLPTNNVRTEQYTIPYATYQKNGAKVFRNMPEYSFPASFIKYGVEKIVSSQGYELKHNLTGLWEDFAINVCDLMPGNDSMVSFFGRASGRRIWTQNGFTPEDIDLNANGNFVITGNENEELKYTAQFDGSILIGLSGDATYRGTNAAKINIWITNNDENIYKFAEQTLYPDQKIDFPNLDKTVNVNKGNEIKLHLSWSVPDGTVNPRVEIGFSYDLNSIETEQIPIGAKLYIAQNIGFNTQFDYLKAIMQCLAITINVDDKKKIVELYTMKKLYDNKEHVIDWTGKMHKWNQTREFSLRNYARENYILFQENTDDNFKDEGFFTVNNRTLDRATDLFTIPFESGIDTLINSLNIPNTITASIPLMEVQTDGDGTQTSVFKKGKPHFLRITPKFGAGIIPVQVATHIRVQELINTFYYELVNKMLIRANMVKAEFLLTPQDIQKYNKIDEDAGCSGIFIPIYLQEYGSYFYINKIENYQRGRLTKCELVRL